MDNIKRQRKVGKAAVLPTAPAFTWPKARETAPADPGPGPGQYDPSLGAARGVGFGSSTRNQKGGDDTPSPGDYKQDPSAVLRAAPGYTFRAKSVPDHLKSKTPGPGQYNQDRGWDVVKPSASAYTLASKAPPDKEMTRVPAPNAYNATGFRVKGPHGATLKFRHSTPQEANNTPSPVEYADMYFKRPASEGPTFGISRDSQDLANGVPGPGQYRQGVAAVCQRPQSWSIPRSMRDPRPDNGVPGPGTYMHGPVIDRDKGHGIRSDNRSAPAYSVAGRPFVSAEQEIPGPSDYGVPKDPMRRSYPAFTFRGVKEKDAKAKLPGPGAYDPALSRSTPAFSIAFRPDDPAEKERRPGPQAYNPKLDTKPGVTLKFRHDQQGRDTGPGPQDYADKDFRKLYCPCSQRKGFSFGVKPSSRTVNDVPGPIYQIGCTTLGIATAVPMTQKQINQIAVL